MNLCKHLKLALIVLTFPAILFAQEMSEYNIYGFVTDSSTSQSVSGVLVEAINEADTTERASDISDGTGRYVISLAISGELWKDQETYPSRFSLKQNYPNPFNPATIISFQVPKTSHVSLAIYNTLGQKISELLNERVPPGSYLVEWDGLNDAGTGVAAGIYFYRLQAAGFTQTRKMVLLDGSSGSSSRSSSRLFSQSGHNRSFSKSANLQVTIRATSPLIEPFEQQHVNVTSQFFRFDFAVKATSGSHFNRNFIVVSDVAANGKVYISGITSAIKDTILGTEKVAVINQNTLEEEAMRVNYDGSFPTMDLNGIIGDQIVLSLTRDGQLLGNPEDIIVGENIPPMVVESKPTNGDKDIIIDAVIFVHFSEPVDTATVNGSSYFLTDSIGNFVPGVIGFLNESTVASLDPTDPLLPLNRYTVTVTTAVTDLQSLPMDSTFSATFTTAADSIEGTIAFHKEWEDSIYHQGIYLMDPNGNVLSRLTKNNLVDDAGPSWSPDGMRLCFVRNFWSTNEAMDIYIMNYDGTYPENLTPNTPNSTESESEISPDGTKIVFTSDRTGNREIYIMNINGSDLVKLTDHPSTDRAPSWSHDGRKIVFSSDREGEYDILVMERDGQKTVNLTTNLSGSYYFPSWSPNGSEIAFLRSGDLMYIMDSNGLNPAYLTNALTEGKPVWSPDGRKIAYMWWEPNSSSYAIFTIKRDGTSITLLTPHPPLPVQYEIDSQPAWTPIMIR